jgi:photosystem II stability/assembly factor-like uncharacterized protein
MSLRFRARFTLLAAALCLVTALFGAAGFAHAAMRPQWYRVGPTDQPSATFGAVDSVGEARAWVVGSGGLILATRDAGATWETQSSGVSAELRAISFVDAERGWVVGDGGAILATTDGGTTWVAQSSGTTADLCGCAFQGPDHGCAVGDYGTILTTSDGGDNWFAQQSGSSADLRAVAFADELNGTAIGSWERFTLTTADGGATWATRAIDGITPLKSVAYSQSSRAWVVDSWGLLYTAEEPMGAWSNTTAPQFFAATSVTFSDPNRGWLVGGQNTILRTEDGGATWVGDSLPASTGALCVSFSDTLRGWVVGHWGQILTFGSKPDASAPVTTLRTDPDVATVRWNCADVAVGLDATDTPYGSGVVDTRVSVDGALGSFTGTITLSTEGTHTVRYWSIDASGNVEASRSATIAIDKSLPEISLNLRSDYYRAATIMPTVGVDTLSGVKDFHVRLDDQIWSENPSVTTYEAGLHTLWARVTDNAGNVREVSAVFNIPWTPPPKPSLSTPVVPSRMSHSRSHIVYGYLKPWHGRGTYPVRIYKYRYVSGHWRSHGYDSAVASDHHGYTKYSRSVRLPHKGRWRLRAYAPADDLHAAAWSSGYDYVSVY